MYLHLETFRKAIRTAFFHRPFRVRRWILVVGFTILFLFFWGLLALGRVLDNLLYRGWQHQSVTAPVFIVATPRSGTTFLQRLLSLDEARFKSLCLYEMVFSAVIWQRAIQGVSALDRVFGGGGKHLVEWLGRLFFGGWDDRHLMRLDLPEEDEGIYIYTLATEAVYLLFPYFDELPAIGFADKLPSSEADRIVDFFDQSVRRLLFASGQGRTVLTKSTCSLGRIQTLRRAYPDARFIHLVRHPAEAIASHINVFFPIWQRHSPEIQKISPETRAYAELAANWYRHMFDTAPLIPEDRYMRVMYDDLVADPGATVRQIYAHFGMDMGQDFAVKLEAAVDEARGFRSSHQYSLAEFGLDETWLDDQLGDVLRSYGFRTRATQL
ncbi:MAG: sulfotransferase [Geminicoccaceae bacterium]